MARQSGGSTMALRIERFNDAQQHADALAGWKQSYYQLSGGPIECRLAQTGAPGVHMFREGFSQRVAQYGAAPPRMISFALVLGAGDGVTLNGAGWSGWGVHALRGGAEFVFHVGHACETLVVSVDADELAALLDGAAPALPRDGACTIALRPERHAGIAAALGRAMDEHGACPAGAAWPRRRLRDEVMSLLADLLAADAPPRGADLSAAVRRELVCRSRELALAHGGHAIGVLELCRQLRLSRRALQYAFRETTGLSPLAYLRSLRLGEVRRALLRSARAELSIGDAAAQRGFFHLSHFTADYKRLFGELPSQTPRRIADSG